MSEVQFISPKEVDRIRGSIHDRYARCAAVADICRLNALSMITYAGSGHIGSSFSAMDLVCWLWMNVLEDVDPRAAGAGDRYFSSKGHDVPGLYAVLISLGLLDATYFTQLRCLGGLPGHPDVATPYMVTNTGPLGMGVSKARGLVRANRLNGESGRVFVLAGDGELQEGQFWESLQPTANGRFGEITVIVDHNKLQPDTYVSDVSDLGDIDAKVRSFGWEVARCDGHDFRAIEEALETLAGVPDRPKLLIADTVKGRGVSFMDPGEMGADRLYGFHSGAPSTDQYEEAAAEIIDRVARGRAEHGVLAPGLDSIRVPTSARLEEPARLIDAYSEALVELAREREDIVALDGDLMLDTGLVPFRDAFPDRFIECGIAEQDMVSQAGALALKGLLPVVHSFACFLSTRANEQIYNNATEQTKVIYHASLAGLLPGGPGHSHQSVRDISAVGSVPNLTMIQPSTELETKLALRWAAEENPGSTYIRLASVPYPVPFSLPTDYRLVPGRGVEIKSGSDAAVIAYGPVMTTEALTAARSLEVEGLSIRVINLPWLNRIDGKWLTEAVEGATSLFLVEDHYEDRGQGAFVTAELMAAGLAIETAVFGVEGIPACGQNAEVLAHHGLDAHQLAHRIQALM